MKESTKEDIAIVGGIVIIFMLGMMAGFLSYEYRYSYKQKISLTCYVNKGKVRCN